MKKMDLHIHTVSTKRDKPFAFSIEKLKGYVIQEKVDLIAITNHNLFDAQQFSDITNALPIKVFPGIEVDIEGGHVGKKTPPSIAIIQPLLLRHIAKNAAEGNT